MIDNKTTNYNFPLPNAENTLLDDCDRISSAISKIDNEINNLNNVVNTKIDNEINNLNNVVNTKLTAGSLKTINKQSIIGDGNIEIVTQTKTLNGLSLQGQGNIALKTINGNSIIGEGDILTHDIYTIGTPGTCGFGVGACPDIADLNWISPLPGHNDPASANYGNYITQNGSVMVCIPKFFYRRAHPNNKTYATYELNSLDIVGTETFANEAEANASGYALPRAFIDNGEEKDFFFIDKYKCGKYGSASCSSLPNVNPISLTTSNGYTKSQGMTNCSGIIADAITLSRARGEGRFQCQSVFMNAALQMLIDAHAQAATSTNYCAWYDGTGVKNYPKGCNNNALADVDDTTVTYAQGDNGGSSYKKPKTRATANFVKTTHNGQACGVADLNGMLYEVLIGVTNIGANDTAANQIQNATAYVLKRSAKLADLTSGWNGETDAWGTAEKLATRYDLVNDFFIGTNGAISGRVGNGENQVFSGAINNTDTEYLRANCGYVKDANSISSNGSNMYGVDYYSEYNRENLVVLGSFYWGDGTTAGAFSRNCSFRSRNSGNFGFRASAYN